jgi:L-malate glycosyltransferase
MVEAGCRVSFLRLERGPHQLESRAMPVEVEQVRWAGGRGPVSWRDGFRLLPDLKRVLKAVRPDLVFAGPIQRTAFLSVLAGYQPLVSMSWGYDLLHDARRNRAWAWVTRFTLRRSAAMVGDCHTICELAIMHGMNPDRIVTFPWGVDLNHFSPANDARERDQQAPFELLSTRSWEPIYGVDLIARAFVMATKTLQQQGGPQLKLVMTGNGSQAGELRQIFTQADLLDRVYFPGQVGFAELPRYYHSADLYVSASHSDGSSISLLEALACGKPALVSDIPGNREWINPGDQGWWFQDGSVEALYEGILQAVQHRSRLPEMGKAARQLAESRADWSKNSQDLLKAFKMAKPRR